MTERDPLAILAGADPAKDAPRFDPQSARGQALLQRTGPDARRRRSVRRIVLMAAAAGAVAAAAAAAYFNTREAANSLSVACHNAPPPDQRKTLVVGAQSESALDACWRLWRAGAFSPTPTPARLIGCVGKEDTVAVYPGGLEVCARLGMAPAPTDAGADPKVARLEELLQEARLRGSCLTKPRAREIAEEALVEAGLRGWLVVDGQDAECTTFQIDEPVSQVVLIPDPGSRAS